ncbi:MAG TPA: VOC family protein [Gaiellaceae bacterium]|nr:VOC family protein [Gaiellaceae bacterium]
MIRVSGIGHVHLHVGDVSRSLRFYVEAFGAEETFRVGDQLVFVRLSGSDEIVALDGRSEAERNPQHIGLDLAEGESLEDAVRDVEAAGGRVIQRGEHAPGIPYAYVADPDGNVLEV